MNWSLETMFRRSYGREENIGNREDIEIISDIKMCKILGGPFIKEIVHNLIKNSIHHANCKKIIIETRTSDDVCIITVKDDGKGIPKEKRQRIFDLDYSEKPSSGGLGLHIIKEIIESYCGSIEVMDSELGGARFDVKLKKIE